MKFFHLITKNFILTAVGSAIALGIIFFLTFPQDKVDISRIYRIGYGNDAPFHFDTNNKPSGLAVELVNEAAKREGLQLEWIKNSGFDANKMDFWVLMTIKPERRKNFHFTEPYLQSRGCFLVLENSPFNQTQDLSQSRISYVDYAIHRDNLNQFLPDSKLVPANNSREAVILLLKSQSDAVYLDQYAALRAILEGGLSTSVRIIRPEFPPMVMGLASSHEEASIADLIRKSMQSMVNDGKVTEIISRWAMFPRLSDNMVKELVVARRQLTSLYVFSGLLVFYALFPHSS